MKKNSFSKLDDQALFTKLKLVQGVLLGFSLLYAIIILVLLYLFFNRNFGQLSVAIFVPIIVLPAVFSPLVISFSMLKKEKTARNL
jgi:hypothetical protein